MSEEERPEYARYMETLTMLTSVTGGVLFIAFTLILLLAPDPLTNGMVGIVLFLIYVSMAMLTFVTGEFLTAAFVSFQSKPEMTTRGKVVNALFLAAILLWMFAADFMFLIKDLAYHFAVGVTVTVIVYVAMLAYTFMTMWKHR